MEYKTKNNFKFIYLLIIISVLIKNNFSYIVLPFKVNTPPETSNITEIVYNLIDNKLVITLPLGEPTKNIDFYSSMNEYLYYLEEGSCLINSSPSYYFNNSKSFSIIDSNIHCNIKLDSCSLGKEKLYLYKDINLEDKIVLSPFLFYFGNRNNNEYKNNKKICGILGFQIENKPFHYYEYDNFIKILKNNLIINSYSWYIHYYEKQYKKNENEYYDGAIIFDIFNQKFFDDFPYLKGKDNINFVNAKDLEGVLAWTLTFEEIYFSINDTKVIINNKEGGLAFETDFIICSYGYFESIKNKFFNFFLINKICFLSKGKYSYIYCDKNKFKENINNFPILYFKSIGMNKTFTLTGNDLFKEYNNYFLFMIIFKEFSYKLWTFGKTFMKKYNFFFDNDKKIIGCFNINNEKEGHKFISFFDKIKWYIFIIIGIIIGFLIGKRIRDKTRKLRANELEDNFEYLTNKANNSDINSISNYKEIKSQLFDINQENNN